MKEILIVVSSTLIPAIITLITVIFSSLGKYKKEIIQAQKGTEELQKEVKILNEKLIAITDEKIKLEKENDILLYRIKELEIKVKMLEENKKAGV